MTTRAAARRYGVGLFDVSLKEADLEKVERDFASFVALLGEQRESGRWWQRWPRR